MSGEFLPEEGGIHMPLRKKGRRRRDRGKISFLPTIRLRNAEKDLSKKGRKRRGK